MINDLKRGDVIEDVLSTMGPPDATVIVGRTDGGGRRLTEETVTDITGKMATYGEIRYTRQVGDQTDVVADIVDVLADVGCVVAVVGMWADVDLLCCCQVLGSLWVTYKEGGCVSPAVEAGTVTTSDWADWTVTAATADWRKAFDDEMELIEVTRLALADGKPDVTLR